MRAVVAENVLLKQQLIALRRPRQRALNLTVMESFVFGFGSGHAGRQGEAFGFPLDKTVGRYEEALQIVVPLLRDGEADFNGEFHSAVRQQSRPRGPSCGTIPLMLGAHGPQAP